MLRKLLPHAAIIISVMYFLFFFIDRVNASMNFIDNGITKALLFALALIAILESIWIIADTRRRERERERERRARMARAREQRYNNPYRR